MVSDENWSAPEVLEIPAGGSAQYEVTYLPLTMTKPAEEGGEVVKHAGSVFFPLPDGSAILHTLEGEAQPPEPAGTIAESVAAKAPKTLSLKLRNWLQQPQRFRVDIRAPDKEASTLLQGHEYVDVPAGLTREYALKFYSYKEGVTNAEVHFINERTDEYLFYKLELKAEAPGTLQTIELQAPLRQLSRQMLPLTNPLEAEVSFTASVDNAEVSVPATLVVPANNEAEPIEWRPLLPKDSTSTLTIPSAGLGAFVYDLQLGAAGGRAEDAALTVALGDANSCASGSSTTCARRRRTSSRSATARRATSRSKPRCRRRRPRARRAPRWRSTSPSSRRSSARRTTRSRSRRPRAASSCARSTATRSSRSRRGRSRSRAAPRRTSFKNVFAANADFTFTAEPALSVAKPRETIPREDDAGRRRVQARRRRRQARHRQAHDRAGRPDQSQWVYYLSGSS